MPVASSPSTSRRLLALLSLLQSRRDWPAPVLAERLEVSERTVRRDIERLRELDYTIDATRGPDGGYRLGAGSTVPPLLFDDEQVIALTLALRSAGALGAGLEDAAERALTTVTRLLPSRLAPRVEGLAQATSAVAAAAVGPVAQADPAVLARIGEAIHAREQLRFDYTAPAESGSTGDQSDHGGTAPVRVVEPHHLLLSGGRWYLVGYSPEREDWRTYRVDRIAPRSHTGRRFDVRRVPGGDPSRYLIGRFRGSDDGSAAWPCAGEAVLGVALGTITPYLEAGTGEDLGDGRCRIRLGSWSWDGLAAVFCRFPAPLSEVHPAELRSAFAALSERAAAAAAAARGPRQGAV
ncbi:helix-turn-helix transcriptional regulator [Herbiconiux solani]|uniref:helix-turn-helix transcriptional regulator n=1 Tax=Herbiconiux solani TaxID=661329 RepID=UPI0008251DDE|nr:WYL domain-containing protein [Herbiconiux solani]